MSEAMVAAAAGIGSPRKWRLWAGGPRPVHPAPPRAPPPTNAQTTARAPSGAGGARCRRPSGGVAVMSFAFSCQLSDERLASRPLIPRLDPQLRLLRQTEVRALPDPDQPVPLAPRAPLPFGEPADDAPR